jgi:FKBP-type peptidyl-prolyl cis-trans isomerase
MKLKNIIVLAVFAVSNAFSVSAQESKSNLDVSTTIEGRIFLEKNKTQKGVKITASGLQYKIVNQGKGLVPKSTDKVSIKYSIHLINGKKVLSTDPSGSTWEHHIDKALPGMQEALCLMPEGSKYIIYLPSGLGFGEQDDVQSIPPGSALICELELIKIL